MSFNFYLGASLWGFVAALLINLTTRRRPTIGADAAIGIITTASFAVGVALISRYRTFTRDFDAALFGNILGVDEGDLLAIVAVTAAVALVVLVAYRQLLFATFDPEVAPVFGVPTGWLDAVFALALAGTVVVSMQVLGVTMIAAAIVIPPIVARLLTDSFHRMVLISTGVGAARGLAAGHASQDRLAGRGHRERADDVSQHAAKGGKRRRLPSAALTTATSGSLASRIESKPGGTATSAAAGRVLSATRAGGSLSSSRRKVTTPACASAPARRPRRSAGVRLRVHTARR
jgi:hypothetical protein